MFVGENSLPSSAKSTGFAGLVGLVFMALISAMGLRRREDGIGAMA